MCADYSELIAKLDAMLVIVRAINEKKRKDAAKVTIPEIEAWKQKQNERTNPNDS